MKDYIKQKERRKQENTLFGTIPVFIKDELPSDIELGQLLKKVENTLPDVYFHGIDVVYVGEFAELIEKKTNAMLRDGAVYISNQQDDSSDMMDDLIHEIGHNVEELAHDEIYGDGTIEEEFLRKRERLAERLRARGLNPPYGFEREVEWSDVIDDFLFKEVTYDLLWRIAADLFTSPYGATSLREYFANAFEGYYLGKINKVRKVSPQVFTILTELEDIVNGN